MNTGRSGKIGAIARLLEKCLVPIISELADRCHECDGDGTLMPIDGGDAGRRSRRNLAGVPFLEGLDLLRRPPTPTQRLQLFVGPITDGAVVGRRGIVGGSTSTLVIEPALAFQKWAISGGAD